VKIHVQPVAQKTRLLRRAVSEDNGPAGGVSVRVALLSGHGDVAPVAAPAMMLDAHWRDARS